MTTRRCYEVQGHFDYEGFRVIAIFNFYGEAKKLREYLKTKDTRFDSITVQPRVMFKTLDEALGYEEKKRKVFDILRLRRLIRDGKTHILEMEHTKNLLTKYKDKI